jgi:hypothetical protein
MRAVAVPRFFSKHDAALIDDEGRHAGIAVRRRIGDQRELSHHVPFGASRGIVLLDLFPAADTASSLS